MYPIHENYENSTQEFNGDLNPFVLACSSTRARTRISGWRMRKCWSYNPLIFPDFAALLVYISASRRGIFFFILRRLSFKLKKNYVRGKNKIETFKKNWFFRKTDPTDFVEF